MSSAATSGGLAKRASKKLISNNEPSSHNNNNNYTSLMNNSGIMEQPPVAEPALIVEAMYRFHGADKNQLSLEQHERIKVLSRDNSGWWIGQKFDPERGTFTGTVGIFPSNYVKLIQDTTQGATSNNHTERRIMKPKDYYYYSAPNSSDSNHNNNNNNNTSNNNGKSSKPRSKKASILEDLGFEDEEEEDNDDGIASDNDNDNSSNNNNNNDNSYGSDFDDDDERNGNGNGERGTASVVDVAAMKREIKELRRKLEAAEEEKLQALQAKEEAEKLHKKVNQKIAQSGIQMSVVKKEVEKLIKEKEALQEELMELREAAGITTPPLRSSIDLRRSSSSITSTTTSTSNSDATIENNNNSSSSSSNSSSNIRNEEEEEEIEARVRQQYEEQTKELTDKLKASEDRIKSLEQMLKKAQAQAQQASAGTTTPKATPAQKTTTTTTTAAAAAAAAVSAPAPDDKEVVHLREQVALRDKELERLKAKLRETEELIKKTAEALEHDKRQSARAIEAERQSHCKAIEELKRRHSEELSKIAAEAEESQKKKKKSAEAEAAAAGKQRAMLIKANRTAKALKKSQRLLRAELAGKQKLLMAAMQDVAKKAIPLLMRELGETAERYKKEVKLRRSLFNQLQELKGNIRVYCRVRPLNPSIPGETESAVRIDAENNVVTVHDRAHNKNTEFEFERAFGFDASQERIFEEVEPLATSVLDGYNVCIFAYGQTGSGKTYTMEGTPTNRGVNYRTLSKLFELRAERSRDYRYSIRVSVMEIYNETLIDLLASSGKEARKTVEIRQSKEEGIVVPDMTVVEVENIEALVQTLNRGYKNRAISSTNMNEHSSRSHCILSVHVESQNLATGQRWKGRLNLVDLAGSERVKKSNVSGDGLKEAQAINKSLSCLGDVISALAKKEKHVPYRNSKLTYLLQDSLGGAGSKTLMFVNISPTVESVSETLCSLNFAARVRSVELGEAKKHHYSVADAAPAQAPSSSK